MRQMFAKSGVSLSTRLLAAAALGALMAPLPASANDQPAAQTDNSGGTDWRIDQSWPALPLPHNYLLGDVSGVNVDRHNHIWVVHRPAGITPTDVQSDDTPPTAKCCAAAPSVLEFDTAGNLLRSWGGNGHVEDWFNSEHAIFVDVEDNVWLVGAGAEDGQLMKFTMDGELLLRIGKKGDLGKADNPAALGLPTDIYVDTQANEVYVSDGYRNHRVVVFDSETGDFKRQWTAFGKKVDPDYISGPEGIGSRGEHDEFDIFTTVHCVTMIENEVHVCDRTNKRIQVFKPDGTYIREIFYNKDMAGGAGSTWDAAPVPGHPDQILALDGVNSEFAVLDRKSGEVISSYQAKGRYAPQMHWPHQAAFDQQGRLYVAQVGGAARIQRYEPNTQASRAVYITKEEIARVTAADPVGDKTLQVIDIGHENFSVGIVHRFKTVNGKSDRRQEGLVLPPPTPCGTQMTEKPEGGRNVGIIHTKQTEGYYITSGGGTMFTDGYIVNGDEYDLAELNGPTCLGTAYGVTIKEVKEGDVVVVPAGVVHGWIDVPDHVTYISFRPSPGVLEPDWVHPEIKQERAEGE